MAHTEKSTTKMTAKKALTAAPSKSAVHSFTSTNAGAKAALLVTFLNCRYVSQHNNANTVANKQLNAKTAQTQGFHVSTVDMLADRRGSSP